LETGKKGSEIGCGVPVSDALLEWNFHLEVLRAHRANVTCKRVL
jgi:hypothetical protein